MLKKKFKGGIIGCGIISRNHLQTFAKVGIECIALCDINLKNAEKLKNDFNLSGIKVFKNHKDLLKMKEIDIVSINTPPYLHYQQVIDSLKAGKNTVCEKPSAFSIKESRDIINTCKKTKKIAIYTPARMRWGYTEIAKEYIDRGKLGKIYRVDVKYFRDRGRPGLDVLPHAKWFLNKKLAGGGITPDMGQYFMDMVFHLTNWPDVISAQAMTFKGFPYKLPKNIIYDVEEHCSIFAYTRQDITFSFDFANIARTKQVRKIMIMGTKGSIIIEDGRPFRYITEKKPWENIEETIDCRMPIRRSNQFIYEELLKYISGKKANPGTTPEQAFKITQLNLMAYLSAKKKRGVIPADISDFRLNN